MFRQARRQPRRIVTRIGSGKKPTMPARSQKDQTIIVPWITALQWTAVGESFSVEADIGDVLAEHGAGVYSITLWGDIDGERAVISEYSIFHGITPPGTYARTPAGICDSNACSDADRGSSAG